MHTGCMPVKFLTVADTDAVEFNKQKYKCWHSHDWTQIVVGIWQ